MDTDSTYTAISGDSFESLIKPGLHEKFEKDKQNWFVTPTAPQGKCTPGLFKIEFQGDKIVSLCSKSYCIEKFATKSSPSQVKFSMKGVNKKQLKKTHASLPTQLLTKFFVLKISQWRHTSNGRMP